MAFNEIEKGICKILNRIEEETVGIREAIEPHVSCGSASPKPHMSKDTFESIAMCADAVHEWAERLCNFASMAAEGEEITDPDWEDLVPGGRG